MIKLTPQLRAPEVLVTPSGASFEPMKEAANARGFYPDRASLRDVREASSTTQSRHPKAVRPKAVLLGGVSSAIAQAARSHLSSVRNRVRDVAAHAYLLQPVVSDEGSAPGPAGIGPRTRGNVGADYLRSLRQDTAIPIQQSHARRTRKLLLTSLQGCVAGWMGSSGLGDARCTSDIHRNRGVRRADRTRRGVRAAEVHGPVQGRCAAAQPESGDRSPRRLLAHQPGDLSGWTQQGRTDCQCTSRCRKATDAVRAWVSSGRALGARHSGAWGAFVAEGGAS